MDIGSIFVGVALLLVVVFFVTRPLTEQGAARERELTPADHLLFERDRTLTVLRDLDFDHATGKILDDDYAAQRAQLVAQGVSLLKQLDTLATGAPRSNGHAAAAPARSAGSAEDEIEQAVARLRGRAAPAAREARPAPPAARTVRLSAEGATAAGRDQRGAAPRHVDDEIEASVAQRRTAPRSVDDEIEASIAQRRGAPAAGLGNPCPKCGTATSAEDRFCPACGTELAGACGRCGRRARPDDKFCGNCGAPLDTAGDLSRTPVKG